VFFPARIEAIV